MSNVAIMKSVVALLLLTCGTGSANTPPADEPKRLNVVFILADDLGWGELGCYGQRKIPTPNIDRLAAEGTRFTQHYAGAPVCAPSRCVLMTGKHLGHAEIRNNQQAKVKYPEFPTGQHPLSDSALTVAQLFQQAGYATGAMGKWGLGPVGSTGEPNRKGFDLFFGYNCQAVAHSYYPPSLWRNREQVEINRKPIPGHLPIATGEVLLADTIGEVHAPSLLIAEAEKFIEAHRADPFFLYLPFTEPHAAIHPPRDSVARFPAEWDTTVYRGEARYLPHPRPRAGYAAMISDLDGYVGRVLAMLEKANIADHTLVVFTSDNGTTHPGPPGTHYHVGGVDANFFQSTANLRGYKGSVYEGGIRVPMIARLPGRIPAGAVNETPSSFADWFPTLCEAARLPSPRDLDGQSLWPLLTGKTETLDPRPLIWIFPAYGGQVAVRIGDFKVVRQGLQTNTIGPWELYDLHSDPAESNDLATERPEWIQQAIEILKREVHDNPTFPITIPGVNDSPVPHRN